MKKDILITEHQCGLIRIGRYETDGASYKAVAIRWQVDESCQRLGRVSDGWLVVNCVNRQAYLFQAGGVLTDDYIKEKLGLDENSYPFFGNLIRALLQREG